MTDLCILICNQLNRHREVLLGALRAQRPHLRVHAVAPGEIAAGFGCSDPRLIICSDPAIIQCTRPDAFILLYGDDENRAHVGIGGALRTLFDATLPQLLSVIDEVWPAPDHPNG